MTELLRACFEAHLTVDLRPGDAGRFEAVCRELGVKPLVIEAPGAALPVQPMSASFHHGNLEDVQDDVTQLAHTFSARGFRVQRIKLEAVGHQNPYLPTSAAQVDWTAGQYFELHLCVMLGSSGSPTEATPKRRRLDRRVPSRRSQPGLVELRSACTRLGVHLSRNARRTRADGGQDWFVTLRLRGVGRDAALARHTEVCAALRAEGFALTPGTLEFAVADTGVGLDRGWVEP